MKPTLETVVSLCDWHIPYHDPTALELSFKITKTLNPKIIVIHECIDLYSLSKFDKDPARKLQLQDDLDLTIEWLTKLRKMFPKQTIVMVESNHDKRLKKYLQSKAEELCQLRCLRMEELLALDKLNIEFRQDFTFKNILFKHGSIVRKHSGYTAKGELEREGMSGASGHTHRLGVHFKTLRGGKYVWLEGGCLCDPHKAEYIEGTADWQNGIVGFDTVKGKSRFYPFIIPIINGKAVFGKTLYAL